MKTAPSVLGCDRFLLAGEATNQKKGHGCVKIDTPWPFSILILRDARAPKRRAILKPFCDAIWGPGQASNPRQSRESQPFVRLPPLYSPFSSIVTPYNAPVSVQSGAADIDVRRGGMAMPLWAVTQRENFRHEN